MADQKYADPVDLDKFDREFATALDKERRELAALPRIHRPGEAIVDIDDDAHLDDASEKADGKLGEWAKQKQEKS